MPQTTNDKIAIDFIDPLFAVVLNVSLAQIILQPWFLNWHLIFQEPTIFQVATLSLAYLTVVLSWVGYHQSVSTCQIGVGSFAGRARFYLDIGLLISYCVLLVSYQNFRREIMVVGIIFCLYWAWDQFKHIEWPDNGPDSTARRGVTVVWLILFVLLAVFYQLYPQSKERACEDWLVLLLAMLGTFLYRWHKKHLWPKKVLIALGFPGTDV